MTTAEAYKQESPGTYDSWIKMNHSLFRLVQKKGIEVVNWKHMSVDKCKWFEKFAVEEEFYEAAAVYRDGITKCFDYNEPNKNNGTYVECAPKN